MSRRRFQVGEDALEPEGSVPPVASPAAHREPEIAPQPPEHGAENASPPAEPRADVVASADAPPPAVDPRAAALLFNQGLVEKVRFALDEADTEFAESRLLDIAEAVQTIRDKQKSVKRSLVEIGEALEKLWDFVGEGGYKALRERGLIELTAGPASQYKSIAEAVREGRVSEDVLPNSMTAAYEVVKAFKVNPFVGRQLLDSGVVRPTATKKVIETKVRELLGVNAKKAKRRDPEQVRKRIEETKSELRKLEEMLIDLEREDKETIAAE